MNIFSNGKISWKQKSYVRERKMTCIRMKKVLVVTRNYAKPDSSLFDSKMKTSEQRVMKMGEGAKLPMYYLSVMSYICNVSMNFFFLLNPFKIKQKQWKFYLVCFIMNGFVYIKNKLSKKKTVFFFFFCCELNICVLMLRMFEH